MWRFLISQLLEKLQPKKDGTFHKDNIFADLIKKTESDLLNKEIGGHEAA